MENNFCRLETRFNASLTLITTLLFVFFISDIFAQKISKYYSTHHQENGTIYFIYERDGFKNNSSSLAYDLTYLSQDDSILFSYSIKTKEEIPIDSLHLLNDSVSISARSSKLFIEPTKTGWHYRYTSKFFFKDFQKFFGEGRPTLILHTSGRLMEFTISRGKWKKQYPVVRKIFAVIKLND